MHKFNDILIVEDNETIKQWLVNLVVSNLKPNHLVVCDTFQAAGDAISNHVFQLALVDLGLPDGDGNDLIVPFKRRNPHAICVVATIFDDADYVFTALSAGADGYLLKDETEAEFVNHLMGIAEGRPPISASVAKMMLQHFRSPTSSDNHSLSHREQEVLSYVARGNSVKQTASQLDISYHTASSYLREVYRKLHINSRAQATQKAVELKLI